jgi:hypothetical protein
MPQIEPKLDAVDGEICRIFSSCTIHSVIMYPCDHISAVHEQIFFSPAVGAAIENNGAGQLPKRERISTLTDSISKRCRKAYPIFNAPEHFAPFKLAEGLYYNNAWYVPVLPCCCKRGIWT